MTTVAELIRELKYCNPDAPVAVAVGGTSDKWSLVFSMRMEFVRPCGDNEFKDCAAQDGGMPLIVGIAA